VAAGIGESEVISGYLFKQTEIGFVSQYPEPGVFFKYLDDLIVRPIFANQHVPMVRRSRRHTDWERLGCGIRHQGCVKQQPHDGQTQSRWAFEPTKNTKTTNLACSCFSLALLFIG
jgi:hypothetical protein